MALSRRLISTLCGTVGGTMLLATLAMSPAVAGGAPAAAPLAGGAPAAALLSGGCAAAAHVETQWGSGTAGGQIVSVAVTNTSATTTTKWTVTWTLGDGQRITSAWNAGVTTSGGAATAVNAGYNGVLAPRGSTTFGMQLAGVAPAPVLSCDNGATPPTSSAPPGGPDVSVGPADNQRTITLVVGRTLGVSLGADYLPPTVSGPALAPVSSSGGYPTGQPFAGLYRAVAPGSVDITTHTDHPCLHTTPPCAMPILLWTVHVNVLAAGQDVTVGLADNQGTMRLHVGDTLVVSLSPLHLPPKLSAAGVLVQGEITGGYPTNQPLVARYAAVSAGQVEVSTTTDIACNHDPTPCPSPTVPWSVRVIVTA
jgi:hypothetical protein